MSLQISDPSSLVIECRNVLVDILQYRHLGFSQFTTAGNGVVYELNGDTVSKAEAKYSYNVLPFIRSEAGLIYWITVTLEFQFRKGVYLFQEACFIVFEGMAGDNIKQGILRAEWATRDSDNEHAQPHWHIYPSFVNKHIVALFDETNPITDFNSSELEAPKSKNGYEWSEGLRFHFAMASRWHHQGVGINNEELTQQGLVNWLRGGISYTRDQLIYLESKK